MNLASHHLRALEAVGLVERRVSEGDRRRRYVVLRRDALNGLLLPQAALAPAGLVLFVCTHNFRAFAVRGRPLASPNRERRGQRRERAEREGSSAGCTLGGPQRCRSPRCRSSRVRRGRRRACVRGVGVRLRPRGGNPVRRAGRALVGSRPGQDRRRGRVRVGLRRDLGPHRIAGGSRGRHGGAGARRTMSVRPDRDQRLRPDGPARAARRLGSRDLEFVHVNELDGGPATGAHLLEFDSVHGRWPRVAGARRRARDRRRADRLSRSAEPGDVPWGELGVDVVLECTGRVPHAARRSRRTSSAACGRSSSRRRSRTAAR